MASVVGIMRSKLTLLKSFELAKFDDDGWTMGETRDFVTCGVE
jgi:hypothetical protein